MKTYNVLFIGNSYTYYNKLWDIFSLIANSEGYKVNVDEVTSGGYSLAQMADENDKFGKILLDKLSKNHYDFIVLQEQSLRPAIDKELFFKSVRNLVNNILPKESKILLYETWGRKKGNIELKNHNMTNKTMTDKLVKAYCKIAEELSLKVCHVGKAFYNVNKNFDIELYDADKTHPSLIGSTLAALVIYKTMFDVKKEDINVKILDDDEIQLLLFKESSKVL